MADGSKVIRNRRATAILKAADGGPPDIGSVGRRRHEGRPTGKSISILLDAAPDEASRRAKIACAKKLIS
jgi:hypothetical protein